MEIRDIIKQAFSSYQSTKEEKERLEIIVDGLEKEIKTLSEDKQTVDGAWEALRILLEKFSSESIELLQEMLNKGVKAIFSDRDYSVVIEITDKKKKTMEVFLIENREGEIIKSEIPEGIGGSITVIMSFIFQVFLIKLYKKRPFMLMDESMSQLSDGYIPNFMSFLSYLKSEMGFNFLWITQDPRIQPYFDKIYEVSMGEVKKKSM